jgi:hypothetical protein
MIHARGVLGFLGLVGLAGATVLSGCIVDRPPYECAVDAECVLSGVQGRCHSDTNFCSFPDPTCPTGYRYGRYSDDYADECAQPTYVPPPREDVILPDQNDGGMDVGPDLADLPLDATADAVTDMVLDAPDTTPPPFGVHVPLANRTGGTTDLELDGMDEAATEIDTTALTIGGLEVPDGITFEALPADGSGPELAVLHVGAFTVTTGRVRVTGVRPLVVLAAGAIQLDGVLAAGGVGPLPGPGGNDAGRGRGTGAVGTEGGGGAGFGTRGGSGSATTEETRAAGGAAYGTTLLVILQGGSGGGPGADGTILGGGGGGAVQLSSLVSITIGDLGGIDAGGGGGSADTGQGFGGGGGSGGALVLQAPSLALRGTLSANGGAGGCSTAGEDAKDALLPAIGGAAVCGRCGGNGGYGNDLPEADNLCQGGGGGGAIGRIVLLSNDLTGDGLITPAAVMGPGPLTEPDPVPPAP